MSVGDQGATPRGHAAKGGAPPPGVAALWPPSGLLRTPVRDRKIGPLDFVSSNSENISVTIFLKYKNNRKQELTLWLLVNRLVPENG